MELDLNLEKEDLQFRFAQQIVSSKFKTRPDWANTSNVLRKLQKNKFYEYRIPLKIHRIGKGTSYMCQDWDEIEGAFLTSTGVSDIVTAYHDQIELSLIKFEPGYVNLSNFCAHVDIAVKRQYSWGMHEDKLLINNISKQELNFLNTPFRLTSLIKRKIIWNICNPVYFSYDNLIKNIWEGKRIAGALSKEVAIAVKINMPYPLLFFKHKVIGHVSQEGDIFLSENFQEFREIITEVTKTTPKLTPPYNEFTKNN